MQGVHFSLRWLFGVVSFLAIGCGLLIYASPFLSKLAFSTAVTALLIAVALAIYRTGDQRAFWAGFAAFGVVYVWLVCGTWQSPDGSASLRDRLITTDLLIRCHDVLPSRANAANVMTAAPVLTGPMTYTGGVAFDPYGNTLPTYGSPTGGSFLLQYPVTAASTFTTSVDRTDFLTTGHSLFVVLIALLGGTVTRQCSSRAKHVSASAPKV